jgi:cytochrome c oxidase assembly protein subunit 15
MTPVDPLSSSQLRRRTLRRIAWLCALLVLLIAALSAYLRLSKAGLGCTPWPQCYGQELRAQQQGLPPSDAVARGVALARLAHRVVASVALVLVIVLAMSALTARPRRRDEITLSLALLALALFLAGLGLRTGASRLPAVAIGNLLGGFAMLALSVRLALVDRADRAPSTALSRGAAIALCAVVAQVVLGGLVSASFADLSCGGVADCARTAAQQGWPLSALNPWHEPVFEPAAQGPINPHGALAQLAHRVWAPAVLLAALPTAWLAWRHGARRSATALIALLVLQVAAGLWLLTPVLPLPAALLHNLLAALLVTLLARLL